MAVLMQAFDARNVDPSQSLGGMPIGTHNVVISDSTIKPAKSGESGFLELTLKVIDGEHAGSVGAYRLNLYHSNQQTTEIAHRQLSAICHVTGVYQIQDSSQLHNIPFKVEVGLQKGENPQKYTEVKRVFDINGNEPGKSGQNQPQQNNANAQPQNGGGNNWGGSNNGQPNANNGGGNTWGGGNQNGGGQNNGGGNWGAANGQNQPQNGGGHVIADNAQMPPQNGNQNGGGNAWGGGNNAQPQNGGNQNGGGWNQNQPQNGGNAPWGNNG